MNIFHAHKWKVARVTHWGPPSFTDPGKLHSVTSTEVYCNCICGKLKAFKIDGKWYEKDFSGYFKK